MTQPSPSANTQSTATDNPLTSQEGATELTTSAEPGEYLLAQGDEIAIQVFDEPELTLDTVVGAGGSINYSYLGDVRVAGKSPVQLERHISELLKDGYLVNPSVNVRVLRYRHFYISGQVRSPGSYAYQPGLSVDKAIALAGGLTERASTRKIFLDKEGVNSSDEIKVSLDFLVQPGDKITIKEGFF
ncbi:polysaccharide export protein [Granulosicoccus sp.]|nr:polysaccharide biosynthesis/export family protein [Granulosicoccus sp.]MDB4224146.1 polysaccharide export protein [Granulosicoccus sp.]